MNNRTNTILTGDALEQLRTLPDGFVQTVVTSPPYFALRDYGVSGQIGLEETPEEYVEKLVEVFREVYRVLRDDGTLWCNLGDTYANDEKWGGHPSGKHRKELHEFLRPRRYTALPAKNLIGIPWRVAFALQSDGWILRSAVVWYKPTALPESVNDRPTNAYEHIFLLAKQANYYYDAEAIKDPVTGNAHPRGNGVTPKSAAPGNYIKANSSWHAAHQALVETRNKRNVWTVASQPYHEAHFATFPPKLIEPCILAGSRPGDIVLDPFLGSGTTALVALQHHRKYLGIELNPEYVELARRRIATFQPTMWESEGVAS